MEDAKRFMEEDSPQMRELAREEIERLKVKEAQLKNELDGLLFSSDPDDDKNIILEVRAGTGGEEAALWAADLIRMYVRFAEKKGWKTEVLSQHPTELGGYREVIISIEGRGIFGALKYESGVHRVQRVPKTEASGRIHTSAATVAVMPEREEKEVDIKAEDIKVDTYCASGKGGQHVNKTSSAVRLTHIKSGIVVQCQDERSQYKNKAKALKVLRARFAAKVKGDEDEKERITRKNQVGSGDRSEKIRTYNFPQDRVTDHRINKSLYKLEKVMDGNLEEFIEELKTADRQDEQP
jgi:peptide chain release factor 1